MIQTVDENKRLPLPEARPGDVYEVQAQGDGRFLLTRIEGPRRKPTREEFRKALDNLQSKPAMTWEDLRAMTREP